MNSSSLDTNLLDAQRLAESALSVAPEYPDAAKSLANRALRFLRPFLEASDPRALNVVLSCAGALSQAMEHEQATECSLFVLTMQERQFGASHPVLVKALLTLGGVALGARAYADGETALLRALSILRARVRGDNRDAAAALTDLGNIYLAKKDLHKAEECFRAALEAHRKISGERSIATAAMYVNLSEVAGEAGHVDEGVRLAEAAAGIIRALSGPSPPLVMRAMFSSFQDALGAALTCAGRFSEAERILRESVALQSVLHPGFHPKVAKTHMLLAKLYSRWGHPDHASHHAHFARESLSPYLSEDHPTMMEVTELWIMEEER